MLVSGVLALEKPIGRQPLPLEPAGGVALEWPKEKPHIVLWLVDDQGWGNVGWNNANVMTPEMNELARQGVILDRFYTFPWLCCLLHCGVGSLRLLIAHK